MSGRYVMDGKDGMKGVCRSVEWRAVTIGDTGMPLWKRGMVKRVTRWKENEGCKAGCRGLFVYEWVGRER